MRVASLFALVVLIPGAAVPRSSTADHDAVNLGDLHAAIQTISVGQDLGEPIQVSNRCFTPNFWCYLPGYAPVGANCWCATPNGPVYGVVR